MNILNRFRALFPSWKFFGETGDHLFIEARLGRGKLDWSAWERVGPFRRGVWQEVFHNPYGLLDWMLFSLLQEFGSQVGVETELKKENGGFQVKEIRSSSIPLELIRNILQVAWIPRCAENMHRGSESRGLPDFFQFRIRWVSTYFTKAESEVLHCNSKGPSPDFTSNYFRRGNIEDLFVSEPCPIQVALERVCR